MIKIEMRKRLEVIISASHEIREILTLRDFEPSMLKKHMEELEQYHELIKLDYEALKIKLGDKK